MTGNGRRVVRAGVRRVVRVSAPGVVIPYVFLLLLLSAISIPMISTRVDRRADLAVQAHISRTGDSLLLSVEATPVEHRLIVDTLGDGLRARVTAHVRVSDTSEDRFTLLGQAVLDDFSVEQTLSYDPYVRGYRILDSRSVETTVTDRDAAIERLFRFDGVLLQGMHDEVHGQVRVVFEPRVIPDALYLVRAISGHGTISSPWVDAEVMQ